jgi:hypothetical protein
MNATRPLRASLCAALRAAAALGAILLLAAGCGNSSKSRASWAPQPDDKAGLRRIAFTDHERFVLATAGGERTFIPGVNIGATVPGTLPGELRVGAGEFRRWFRQIGELQLRAVRVYTIMPPSFYQELVAYDRAHVDAPIYLVQGVWIPEQAFLTGHDLFAPAVRAGFHQELDDAVAAVHGDFSRTRRRGTAWGAWTADASPWLLAYSIGVEWDPVATAASDEKNRGRKPYRGRYFVAADKASPTESWLAEMLDTVAAAEAARGVSLPLTFTNWPTTDPLRHPDEPLKSEDLVGIDANHIAATDAWPGGFFASYHAYPYYPDFQRHERALWTAGDGDPYAGYLVALRKHHAGMPVMITEFGVPSSTGMAHQGPLGRDQGGLSEQEAMRIDADLLRIIRDQGCAGGFVFEWTDEWFKFTWNTIDYELPPDRRQLWYNPWTNEEHFGLLAMEPGKTAVVTVDGNGGEWQTNRSQVIFESRGPLREIRAAKDEGYLYLRLVLRDPDFWRRHTVTLGFDVLPGVSGGLPGLGGRYPAADYAVVLGPGTIGRALVRASNDQYVILYGKNRGYFGYDAAALEEGSGVWDLQRLITNRPLTIPSTGEKLPAESVAVGELRYGTSDSNDPAFDSRSVWAAGEVVELRLPWEMIGFSDPSSLRALQLEPDGTLTTVPVRRVGIAVAVGRSLSVTRGYSWDPWQRVTWHERLKAGLGAFADAVRNVQAE